MSGQKIQGVRKNLSLPSGYWQLYAYGCLTAVPTAKQAVWIRGYLRRVSLDQNNQIVRREAERVCRDLPVGELVAWEPGVIFDAQTNRVYRAQSLSDAGEVLDVEVSFDNTSCSFFRRYTREVDGRYTLAKNPGIIPEEDDADSHFLCVQTSSSKYQTLLIPCVTVLQSFWGRSSNLVHMLLDSRFLDFDRYVVNTGRTVLDGENKKAYLWLRQWSLDEDARFLSSIVFDPEAVKRGKQISTHLHAVGTNHGEEPQRHIVALPPYSMPMKLRVFGIPVQTARGTMFYVQKVIDASFALPFNELAFDRDNDGRQYEPDYQHPNNDKDKKTPMGRGRKPFFGGYGEPRSEGQSEFELVQDHPGYSSASNPMEIGGFDQKFPGLNDLKVQKLPQLETKFINVQESEFELEQRWNRYLSTLPASSQSSVNALGVTLVSGKAIFDEVDPGTVRLGPYLGDFVERLIKASQTVPVELNPPRIRRIVLQYIFPWRAAQVHEGKFVFSLPPEHDDRRSAWLYRDPDFKQRRRGVCVQVTFLENAGTAKVGYVIDIEARIKKSHADVTGAKSSHIDSTSMLFLWRKDFSNLNESELINPLPVKREDLQDIIISLVHKRGTVACKVVNEKGLVGDTKRHSNEGVELEKIFEFLYGRITGDLT
jgi:hypothetical protein